MSSGAIGSNASNLNAQRAQDAANQGDLSLPNGSLKATGELKQSNSVTNTNAKLEEQIKLLSDTLMSVIQLLGQVLAGAPNPNGGYAEHPTTEGNKPPPPPSYEQQMADYNTKKAAYDAAQADKQAATDKEAEMKAIGTIADSFDRMVRPYQAIDRGQLEAITKDVKGYTIEERTAAQYFLANPDALAKLQKAYGEFNGGSLEEITRGDTIIRRGTAMAELLQAKQKAAAAEGVPHPGPEPKKPETATEPKPTTGGTEPTGGADRGSRTGESGTNVGGTERTSQGADTLSGDPLERAAQRISKKRDSIEDEIDLLTKKLAELDPNSPSFRKDSTELDRKIKSLANIEAMLNNLESMLRKTIDNIIAMRHDMAMNAINKIS